MRIHKKILLILVAMFAAVTTVAVLRSHGQNDPKSLHGSAEDQIPVVDYTAPPPTDSKKQQKGKRYRRVQPIRFDDNSMPGPAITHWDWDLPALPVTRSDSVVIGRINGAQAHLSSDKTDVYSEFDVRVDSVLKNDISAPFSAGASLVADREGGAVRSQSGRIQQYRILYQGLPRVGGQYVLFLKRNDDGVDYSIVTGYELRAGKVFPLDSAGVPFQNVKRKLVFDAYAGTDETTFMNALRDSLAGQPQPTLETGR